MLAIIAQATAPAAGNQWSGIIMLVLLFVVFYFFMIRPQSKKQKEIQKFRESIQKGDKVITAGGLYGKVRSINETSLVLEIAKDVCVTVDKGSVFACTADTATGAATAEESKK